MGLIDAIRRARGAAPQPPPALDVKGRRVLLVYLFPALGDAVLLAPVVQALLDAGAQPPVGLLLRESASRVWKHVDLRARVHVLPDVLVARPEPETEDAEAEVLKLGVALRKKGYAVAADLTARGDVDARLWVERSEAPLRLGFATGEDDAQLTWACPDERVEALEHWTRYVAAPLAPFGLGALPAEVPFSFSDAAGAKAEQLWGPGRPRVLLVPGARTEDKRFPPEAFVAAGTLARSRGASVVAAGGPGEAELVKSVARDVWGAAYAAKGLGPLVALATTADVVVTNDTGPMHLAFLSGRRTVAIFTTMSAPCWGPMRADPRYVALTAPSGTDASTRPVVERLVLSHLARHLDAVDADLGEP